MKLETLFNYFLVALLVAVALSSLVATVWCGAWWQLLISCGSAILAYILYDESKNDEDCAQ